jgi:hypothetical protein
MRRAPLAGGSKLRPAFPPSAPQAAFFCACRDMAPLQLYLINPLLIALHNLAFIMQ